MFKKDIIPKLKALGIAFDPAASAADLEALLPADQQDGDPEEDPAPSSDPVPPGSPAPVDATAPTKSAEYIRVAKVIENYAKQFPVQYEAKKAELGTYLASL